MPGTDRTPTDMTCAAGGAGRRCSARRHAHRWTGRSIPGTARLFPWGTVSVNVLASLVLGAGDRRGRRKCTPTSPLLIGTGFCGALLDLLGVRLRDPGAEPAYGDRWQAVGNVALSLAAGLGAGVLGW